MEKLFLINLRVFFFFESFLASSPSFVRVFLFRRLSSLLACTSSGKSFMCMKKRTVLNKNLLPTLYELKLIKNITL